MALKEMPKVGDKIRYIGGYYNDDVAVGKTYTINEVDRDGDALFIDDSMRSTSRSYVSNDELASFELVSEPQPDVHALIANLGRRLHEVESELALQELEVIAESFSDEIDAVFSDTVNSPDHYKRGKFETIEVIEEITQGYADGFVAHCAGTAIKYIARAPHKHATPTEDLRKAARYLEFAIKRLEAEASE